MLSYHLPMNRHSLCIIAVLTLGLFGAGCERNAQQIKEKIVEPSSYEAREKALSPEDQAAVEALKDGRLPRSAFSDTGYTFWRHGTDCIGTDNVSFDGGDLLRTIAGDYENIARNYSLKQINRDWLHKTYNQVQGAVATTTDQVFTTQVCRLSNDVTIVSGAVWPKGAPTWRVEGEKLIYDPSMRWIEQKLFLINKDKVNVITGVRVNHGNMTGGDTEGCDASLTKDAVSWDCFMGPDRKADGEPYGEPWYRRYLFSLADGKVTSSLHHKP